MQSKEYRHFRIAIAFSLIMATLLAVFIWVYGKNDSFLIINKSNHPAADYVFTYWTYLGDGIIWVPLVLYSIILKREYLVAIIAAVIISTILTHVMKRIVFPDELRPLGVLVERVRIVDGVEVHRAHSFPSGHTSTAFTMALLLAFRFARMFWTIFFPVVAFFVGYSRVYLAQHFVTDVFAGTLIGIVSAYLSLLIYVAYRKKTDRKKELRTTIAK